MNASRLALLAAALLLAACPEADDGGRAERLARAGEIHMSLLTIDSHVDVPRNFATAEVDPGTDAGGVQVNLPKMESGGLDAVFFSVAVPQDRRTQETYAQARAEAEAMIAAVHRMTEELYPGRIELALRSRDLERIAAGGKLAAMIGLENGFPIGRDLGQVRVFYNLGVRYITLAHIGHNDIADSASPVPEYGDEPEEHGGLSVFGGQVIAEMNRLGIMVDVSHLSKAAMLQATAASVAPVIASHSAARALVDSPRNLDDEQLLALKSNGGVAQVVAYSAYIRANPAEKNAAISALGAELGLTTGPDWGRAPNALIAEYGRRLVDLDKTWPRASVADFVDHIDHIVRLAGVDHVGIGSDFYTGGGAASGGLDGWMDATEGVAVTRELLARGYRPEAIGKIWGGNLVRVWHQAELVAARLQAANGEQGNDR